MRKIKIAFFEIELWEENYVRDRLKGFDMIFFKERLHQNHLKKIEDVNILSPFIYSSLSADSMGALPSLQFIATRSTGFDHIDLGFCKKKRIIVSNVPTYGENTVAEHTFALILALSRKICLSWERTRRGDFSLEGLRGFDLRGKTIGIVGTGHIGRHAARIAKGFGMNVLAFDVRKDEKLAKKLGFQYVSFENLLRNSDIVTLHVPLTKETRHIVNRRTLKLFKRGCLLVNTARGGLCDTNALLRGLKLGIFAGLGLDVLEEECFLKEERELLSPSFQKTCDLKKVLANHILLRQPNVIITPHNAFNSREALARILDMTIENIRAFARGNPTNRVA